MVINKSGFSEIGFLVHTAELFNHYGPVWEKIDVDGFQVIVSGSPFERQRIIELANEFNISHVTADEVLRAGYHFPVLVSNHCLEKHMGKRLIYEIGVRQIRFMYALGKGRHNFSDWNRNYDIILCFGPYQVEKLGFCDSTIKIQMGYPRYDQYFDMDIDRNSLLKELGCDPDRKTIVWMPTWLALSSIDLYADELSKLTDKYNVIVKTHPLSMEAEPEKVNRLSELPFTTVIPTVFDNLFLYKIADYVFCDYGGPSFGALYLDKKLLLLNIPNPEADQLTGNDSPDIFLREDIVNVNPTDAGNIRHLLGDEALWNEQSGVRHRLRRKFFAPNYGFSSDVAALAIKNAETIIKAY